MPPQLPKIVLPKVEVLTKSPQDAIQEVQSSLSTTVANIQANLPKIGQGSAAGLKLPKLEQIFKGPGSALEEIKTSFEATVTGLAPQSGEKKVETEVKEAPTELIEPYFQH